MRSRVWKKISHDYKCTSIRRLNCGNDSALTKTLLKLMQSVQSIWYYSCCENLRSSVKVTQDCGLLPLHFSIWYADGWLDFCKKRGFSQKKLHFRVSLTRMRLWSILGEEVHQCENFFQKWYASKPVVILITTAIYNANIGIKLQVNNK